MSLAFRLVKPIIPAVLRSDPDLCHQISGNGMEDERVYLGGNDSSRWHLKLHKANPLCSVWRSYNWGCFYVCLQSCPGLS